jgi:hypothetical protein
MNFGVLYGEATCRCETSGSRSRGEERIVAKKRAVTKSFSSREKNGKEYFAFNQRDLKLFA